MFEEHHDAILRYFRSRVRDLATAESLAGDVFCRAVAALPSYKPLRGSALPWLYTIAAHRLSDHYRSLRQVVSLDAVGGIAARAPGPEEQVETRELVQIVWSAAAVLPPSQRQALWLRFGEDREYPEIARRLDRSVEAVKLLVHRGAKTLRARLNSSGDLALDRRRLASLAAAGTA